jgi:hypothetical protein
MMFSLGPVTYDLGSIAQSWQLRSRPTRIRCIHPKSHLVEATKHSSSSDDDAVGFFSPDGGGCANTWTLLYPIRWEMTMTIHTPSACLVGGQLGLCRIRDSMVIRQSQLPRAGC